MSFLLQSLNNILLKVNSANSNDQLDGIKHIRSLLSFNPEGKDHIIDAVISKGLIPVLVHFLEKEDSPEIQFEAAWALTNVASGTTAHVQNVIDAEAVPMLIKLLETKNNDLHEQALWALGNIMCEGLQFRDYVIDAGLLKPLSAIVHQITLPVLVARKAAFVIRSICQATPLSSGELTSEMISALKRLLFYPDNETLINSIWALEWLTRAGQIQIDLVIDSGLVPKLVPLLSHSEVQIQFAVLKMMSNIACESEQHIQLIVERGALSHLHGLLDHPKEKLRQESLFLVSNITAGNENQVQAVINANLLPVIVANLGRGLLTTQMEAVQVIVNLTEKGNDQQTLALVQQGVIQPWLDLLEFHEPRLIEKVLTGIVNLFVAAGSNAKGLANTVKRYGGLEKLRNLLTRSDFEYVDTVKHIIEYYLSS